MRGVQVLQQLVSLFQCDCGKCTFATPKLAKLRKACS